MALFKIMAEIIAFCKIYLGNDIGFDISFRFCIRQYSQLSGRILRLDLRAPS